MLYVFCIELLELETTKREHMTDIQIQVRKYKVTVGDINGNVSALSTNHMERAENYASKMLGREWGDDREITIAKFYEWTGTEYKFHSEMEF